MIVFMMFDYYIQNQLPIRFGTYALRVTIVIKS